MAQTNVESRLAAVRELLMIFKLERIVYQAVSVAALLALLTSAVFLLAQPNPSVVPITVLLGASGIIALTHSRLLKMWSDAVRILLASISQEGESDN